METRKDPHSQLKLGQSKNKTVYALTFTNHRCKNSYLINLAIVVPNVRAPHL